MVLISGNKYACETCIKGHRSSTCRHTDRPLFEIKKKGRPVTQCEHCRELRKTKQVHVKCICESKGTHVGIHPVTHKRGHTNIPDSATFPNGLPEALETLVATQTSSEGLSSDSDYSGTRNSCQCKTEGICHCCTPRKSAPRNRKKGAAQMERTTQDSCDMPASTQLSEHHKSRTPSHILARLAELRPVAPRLTSGPLHDPSCGQTIRHHSHENLSFSPYGRAYDFSHENIYDQDPNQVIIPPDAFATDPASSIPLDEQIFRTQLRALEIAATSPWTPTSFPSACGCGESCSCPGCGQHNGNSPVASSSAFSSCTNPGICNTCLDCTILSLPASLPPDTSLSIFDAYQTDSIDEWIRQVSSLPGSSNTVTATSPGTIGDAPPRVLWDEHVPVISEPSPRSEYVVKDCCGVLCKCRPETCECQIDNVDGYDCRLEMEISSPTIPDGAHPYGAARSHSANAIYTDSNTSQYLSIPDVARSRSSSTSSQSSLTHYDQNRDIGYSKVNLSLGYSVPPGRIRGPSAYPGSFSSPDLGKSLQALFPATPVSPSTSSPPRSATSMSPIQGEHSRPYLDSNSDANV